MKIKVKPFLAVSLFILLMVAGCTTKNNPTTPPVAVKDAITLDSIPPIPFDSTNIMHNTAYIITRSCFYTYADKKLHLYKVLEVGDSVSLAIDDAVLAYDKPYYKATIPGDSTKGYISGKGLGFQLHNDFDGDGKMDRILYGYTSYRVDTNYAIVNPIVIKFLSATGATYELHDSGTSAMSIDTVDSLHFTSPTSAYIFHAGYPACAYPQYESLILFHDHQPEIVYHSVTVMDGEYGSFNDYYFPVDSTHRKDTIYVCYRLATPISDTSDEVKTVTIDSTVLFPEKSNWQSRVYHLDSIEKYEK